MVNINDKLLITYIFCVKSPVLLGFLLLITLVFRKKLPKNNAKKVLFHMENHNKTCKYEQLLIKKGRRIGRPGPYIYALRY